MVYENEITSAPGRLNVGYQYDEDRGRVLLRLLSGDVTFRIRTDYNSKPRVGGFDYLEARIVDQAGNSELVYREDMPDRRDIRGWLTQRGWLRTNDVKERSFSLDFEYDILSQYRDGSYSNLVPGPATIEVQIANKPVMTAPTTIPLDANAKVRENVSIVDVGLFVDGGRVEPQATFRNPADHGVQLPLRATAGIGGETIHTAETTASRLTGSFRSGGSEDTTRPLPSFTIPNRTFTDNTLTYTITPTGWADGRVDSRSTTTSLSGVSVDSVSIADCSISPEQVTVPEEATLTATVSNPTPGRVDAELRFVLAGEETFVKQPVDGDSERTFETTYATSEPGEATGEVFLDDVVPL